MPSQQALSLAQTVKDSIGPAAASTGGGGAPPPIPVADWFRPTSSGVRLIPFTSISHFADQEYMDWRTVDPRFDYSFDGAAKLEEWVRTISLEELAACIDETPSGVDGTPSCPAVEFTAWQRLSMIVWVHPPFSSTSSITIDTDTLREVARYTPADLSQRKQPIQAQYSRIAGSMPDCAIIDLPTASGKTAWSLAVAYMVLSSRYYSFCAEFRDKMLGSIFQGPAGLPIARMSIVAVGATTFDHFQATLVRSIPVWQRLSPSLEFVVWSTMSKSNSIRAAANLRPNQVVIWLVPVGKLNQVLRATPETGVALCITDEYTVDTPRQRSRTQNSTVMKHIITQATPQALQDATCGNRSMLKELFGGALLAPKRIKTEIRHHHFSSAQLGCEQLCILDLMTVTHFREFIRRDLSRLVPSALEVHFVKSKRFTLSSFLLDSTVDMVPASFLNVLMRTMRWVLVNEEVKTAFRTAMDVPVITPDSTVAALRQLLEACVRTPSTEAYRSGVERLIDRIQEFASSCPICMADAPRGMNIFGCCGYCVCDDCFASCSTRCAFCRQPVPSRLPRSEVPTTAVGTAAPATIIDLTTEGAGDTELYPPRPAARLDGSESLTTSLQSLVSADKRQTTNLTNALHALRRHDFCRPLILIERHHLEDHDLAQYLDLAQLGRVTGFTIQRVDGLLGGKGTTFTRVKKVFDDPATPPMALLSYGMDPKLLIGTNLDYVDAMITVGKVDRSILTQAINRIFRPRGSRDNTRPMAMVKIYA